MPKHMTLLMWYGDSAGTHSNRRYDIDSNDKFKDFFGSRRSIEFGVWRQSDGNVLVGSKARKRMSKSARELIAKLERERAVLNRNKHQTDTFAIAYGTGNPISKCGTCANGLCTQRCVK